MGICSDDCTCYVEGERGLRSDGTGSASDPYTPQPDTGRWIGRTVNTEGVLPEESAVEDGQLAIVKSTHTLWRFHGAELEWEGVGPEWRQTYPADLNLPGPSDTGWPSESLELDAGFWFICANGYFSGSMDMPVLPATTPPATATTYQAQFNAIQLFDATEHPLYDEQLDGCFITVDSFSFQTSDGVQFGYNKSFDIPFQLQAIASVASGTHLIQITGLIGAGDSGPYPGDYNLKGMDIAAIRVANHDFTV